MNPIHLSKILAFRGSWNSGLGELVLENEDKTVTTIPCDNGPTVRGLQAAFGDFITPNHTASGPGPIGQWIYWSYDDMGLVLGGFIPFDNADPELIAKRWNLKP